MKKKYINLLLFIALAATPCAAQFAWIQKADFTPGARAGAYGFAIDSTCYVGGGIIYNGAIVYQNDFWSYDPASNVWTQKSNYPASARVSSAAFTIGQKGYVCTGQNSSGVYLNDLWQYDPLTNSWWQKAPFPGIGRYGCASFVIGNNAYVGIGKNANATGYFDDCYKYDTANDSWLQVADVPGSLRLNGKGFSLGNYGYIVGGATDVNNYKDLWQYDPSFNYWSQKTSYPGNGSYAYAAFTLNGLEYIGTGSLSGGSPPNTFSDFYSYNPVNDSWSFFCNFPGLQRNSAVSITVGNKGYMGLGSSGVFPVINYLSDWWELSFLTALDPTKNVDVHLNVFPNPANAFISFNNDFKDGNYTATIFDADGKLVSVTELKNHDETIVDVSSFTNGIYLYSITSNNSIVKTGSISIAH